MYLALHVWCLPISIDERPTNEQLASQRIIRIRMLSCQGVDLLFTFFTVLITCGEKVKCFYFSSVTTVSAKHHEILVN